jgi:hypothetical protein
MANVTPAILEDFATTMDIFNAGESQTGLPSSATIFADTVGNIGTASNYSTQVSVQASCPTVSQLAALKDSLGWIFCSNLAANYFGGSYQTDASYMSALIANLSIVNGVADPSTLIQDGVFNLGAGGAVLESGLLALGALKSGPNSIPSLEIAGRNDTNFPIAASIAGIGSNSYGLVMNVPTSKSYNIAVNGVTAHVFNAAYYYPENDSVVTLGLPNARFLDVRSILFSIYATSGDTHPSAQLASNEVGFGTASGLDAFMKRDGVGQLGFYNASNELAYFGLFNNYPALLVKSIKSGGTASVGLLSGQSSDDANYLLFTNNSFLQGDNSSALGIRDWTHIYLSSDVVLDDAINLNFGSGTGTRIGTSTSQKLGFYNKTPVVQPNAVGSSSGYSEGSMSATFNSDDKYTGNVGSTAYTINGIVAALKNLGLIAS